MLSQDADNFRRLMNTQSSMFNKKHPDDDALRGWWMKLRGYDISVVEAAFDTWSDTKQSFPTPADILPLCRPKEQMFAVTHKLSTEELKANQEKMSEIASSITRKASRDWVAYWNGILDAPKGVPEVTLQSAREALKNLGHARSA